MLNLKVLRDEAAMYGSRATMKGIVIPRYWVAALHEVENMDWFD